MMIVALVLGACSATRTQQAPGEAIDDSLLTAKVKAALIEDPVTKARDINVETYRGVVQLAGSHGGWSHHRAQRPGAQATLTDAS
jgi:hyperosmotically inducible protein